MGPNSVLFKFLGRGQRDIPVTNVRAAIQLILFLPGRHAHVFRLGFQMLGQSLVHFHEDLESPMRFDLQNKTP